MASLDVRTISQDFEQQTLYQSKNVRLGRKNFMTPAIAKDPSIIRNYDPDISSINGLSEIYILIDPRRTSTENLIYNVETQRSFNSRISTKWNKINHTNEISICYLDYNGFTYPQNRDLEFLLDTIYSFSDITTLPIVENMTNKIESRSSFNHYINFIDESVDILKTINDKPIIGIIPRISYGYMSDLIEHYIDKDITNFTFDLNRRNIVALTQSYVAAYRKFIQHDLLETSLINAINCTEGRFIKNQNVVSAKNVLGFGFGFDTISRCHRPLKMPSEAWKKLDRHENKIRMFNKNDYGYYRTLQSDITSIFPEDSVFTVRNLQEGPLDKIKRYENLINMEQIGLETQNIQVVIRDEPALEYLQRKNHVEQSDVLRMTKFKDQVNSQSLESFFQ